MTRSNSGFTLFNIETMSGVFPGSRTRIYQRLRLTRADDVGPPTHWGQLQWYEDPGACRLFLLNNTPSTAGTIDQGSGAQDAPAPLFEIPISLRAGDEEIEPAFLLRLGEALNAAGWRAHTCGTCRFWQRQRRKTQDGLPLGHCGWRAPALVDEPGELALQSALALCCAHWQQSAARNEQGGAIRSALHTGPAALDPPLQEPADKVKPLKRTAEQSAQPPNFWERLAGRFRAQKSRTPPRAKSRVLTDIVLERSGLGAGTEACFACQGRIANLGALAVETDQGDKQTWSVWRCRACFSYYLNSWIDRWERLDSLETEESYYRVTPNEALMLLTLIDENDGGEHPARRHERHAQRDRFNDFTAQRQPLSHQIKQGR